MPDQAAIIAEAKARFQEMRAAALRKSPLTGMPDWVRTGAPPPAAELRNQGLAYGWPDRARVDELQLIRRPFTWEWGFSIPCAEAVQALGGLSPLVELGAGTGYWSALLSAAGLDVVATDASASGPADYGFTFGRHHPVTPMKAHDAVRAYPDRDLFCSWPTEGSPWALAALRAMPVGRRIAVIVEPPDGCTATPGFYRFLKTRFERVLDVDIPQFPKLRDALYVFRRVR